MRGYLDAEINEKYRVMAPDLNAGQFRFLAEFGVKGLVTVTVDENAAALEVQRAEITMQLAKLGKEQQKYLTYQTALKDFQNLGMAMKAEVTDRQRAKQRDAVNSFQESRFPVRDLSEVHHVSTFVESAINKYANEQSLSSEETYKVYYLNTQGLGYDSLVGATEAIKSLAGLVAADPRRCCLVLSAPTVGTFGNEYSEVDIAEVAAKILTVLKDAEQRFLVKEISQCFDQESIPLQSKRAAYHKWYVAISDQCDPANNNELMSVFARSLIWKRMMVPCKGPLIQMLPIKSMVDPRRDFSTAKGLEDLSKPSRRKQWLGGYAIPASFLEGLFAGVTPAPTRSTLCVSCL